MFLSEDKINNKLLKKFKKLPYVRDKQLLKLINLLENDIDQINDNEIPMRVNYVQKKELDRSTLYIFNGLFQPLHADVSNLEFLGKFISIPNYALLIVDSYSSKVYVYLMLSRKQILKKLEQFYVDAHKKKTTKNKNTRLQVHNEFQQLKTEDLNDRYKVAMFTASFRE